MKPKRMYNPVNQLEDLYYPVQEVPVFDQSGRPFENYKGIIRPDTNEKLSIVSKNYQLVSNYELITELLEMLEKTDTRYEIDQQHSVFGSGRMNLWLKFPELEWKDSESKNKLSLIIHNSYDQSESIRTLWGAIRGICTNGAIFGELLKKFYGKHTRGFNLEHLKQSFEESYRAIPMIQQRTDLLEQAVFSVRDYERLEENFSKKFLEDAEVYPARVIDNYSSYQVLNLLTYYISHNIKAQSRFVQQQKLIKQFGL